MRKHDKAAPEAAPLVVPAQPALRVAKDGFLWLKNTMLPDGQVSWGGEVWDLDSDGAAEFPGAAAVDLVAHGFTLA
jgi:hypothetical protein